MTTVSHDQSAPLRGHRAWAGVLELPQLWAGLSIVTMWVAVLFDGIYGADIVSNGNSVGGGATTVPSVVVVSLFAFLGTVGVAKYAFRRD